MPVGIPDLLLCEMRGGYRLPLLSVAWLPSDAVRTHSCAPPVCLGEVAFPPDTLDIHVHSVRASSPGEVGTPFLVYMLCRFVTH